MFSLPQGRIRLRPIEESDADLIVKWRNSKVARESFFAHRVVTPDTHIQFVRNRQPHDLVWIVEEITYYFARFPVVGMTSLTVDVEGFVGEYGRTFVDQNFRGRRYAQEIEYTVLYYAFEVLKLAEVHGSVKVNNTAILNLHEKTGFVIGPPNENNIVMVYYSLAGWVNIGRVEFAEFLGTEFPPWGE